MTSVPNDPNHWAHRYPWNKKGKQRRAFEIFMAIAAEQMERGASPVSKTTTKAVLAWLQDLMELSPKDLNQAPPPPPKDSTT